MLLVCCSVPNDLIFAAPDAFVRLIPRTARELRRNFRLDWAARIKAMQATDTYEVPRDLSVAIRIISLVRAQERGDRTANILRSQGIGFKLFRAVGGLDVISESAIQNFAGFKKQRRMRPTLNFERAELQELYNDYKIARLRNKVLRASLHECLSFGCYMSHVSLWIEHVDAGLPFLVILEDDVKVQANFLSNLLYQLKLLPENWGLFYLNGCFRKLGPVWSPGVRVSLGSLCTNGYVISSAAVSVLLKGAALTGNKPIDHMMDEEVLSGRIKSFHADPPLVTVLNDVGSTLAYLK